MSGSSSALSAIVDRMMEKLQRENPDVEYKRKVRQKKEKPCKKRKRKSSPPSSSLLH